MDKDQYKRECDDHNLAQFTRLSTLRAKIGSYVSNGTPPEQYLPLVRECLADIDAGLEDLNSQIELFEMTGDETRRYHAFVLKSHTLEYKVNFMKVLQDACEAEIKAFALLVDLLTNAPQSKPTPFYKKLLRRFWAH